MKETFPDKIINIASAKTVLIVEDSAVQALALIKMLQHEGVSVICASDGQMGIVMAREYQPNLIILDIQIPKMTGLEVYHWLKQDAKTFSIPVILFSAHNEPEMKQAGLDEGAVDFIVKGGYSEIVLLEILRKLHILKQPSEQ